MEIRFDGKSALVTGAGKGMGRGIVHALVKGGAKTFALSRTKTDLDSLKAELPSVNVIHVDLSNWAATRKALEKVGPIDLLVNNAGIFATDSFLEASPEQFDSLFNVNLKAVVNVSQVICKGMVQRGTPGSVVNITSILSTIAFPNTSLYSATKAALEQLTRVMALELGPKKIRVNSVSPTIIWTPMVQKAFGDRKNAEPVIAGAPIGGAGEVKDIVNAVLFLLSDNAAMITGTSLPVDGGRLVV